MRTSTPRKAILALGLAFAFGASAIAGVEEIRYDEKGRLIDDLPSLEHGDTLRIRMQFADPSAPLEWVYQVRYFCADSEQPRDAEPVKTKKKASVFDSELAFDIPIRRDCTPDTKNLTWYVDHASRANHKARVHLHTSLQLARDLF